jgi:hypothetical protein
MYVTLTFPKCYSLLFTLSCSAVQHELHAMFFPEVHVYYTSVYNGEKRQTLLTRIWIGEEITPSDCMWKMKLEH